MPNISRKNMPQVDTQNLDKAVDMVSDKVRVTKGKISVGKLKKSQKELHKDKIEGIAARFTSPDKFKPLIISKDNHIVDGHHRWGAAIHKWGTDVKIPIIRIHLPILKAIKLYKDVADSLNEAITIPIEIGDTVLGGKFKNKRIVVKSIDKNEKGDITINGKPLMKFRLVNEQIGYGIECKNCNHSWDIEPNDDRPYLCHNCGYDSQMQKIDMVGFKDWKNSLKENVAPNHNGKQMELILEAPCGVGQTPEDTGCEPAGASKPKFKAPKFKMPKFKIKAPSIADIQKRKKETEKKLNRPNRKPNMVDGVDVIRDKEDEQHFMDDFHLKADRGVDMEEYNAKMTEQWQEQQKKRTPKERKQIKEDIASWKQLGGFEAQEQAVEDGTHTREEIQERNERISEISHTTITKVDRPIERGISVPNDVAEQILADFEDGEMVEIPDESGHGSSGFSTSAKTARKFGDLYDDSPEQTSIVFRIEPNSNGEVRGAFIDGQESNYQDEGEITRSSKSKAKVRKLERVRLPNGKMVVTVILTEPDDLSEVVLKEEKGKVNMVSRKYLEGPLNPQPQKIKKKVKKKKESSINEFGGVKFDLVGYGSNNKPVLKTIKRASDSFMKDVAKYGSEKLFKSGKNVEYVKIYYDKNHLATVKDSGRKIVKEKNWGKLPINEIPMGDLKQIDTFADKKLNPMDVVLTGKHFFDRLNDPRNGKEVTNAELIGFFKRLGKKKSEFVDFLNQYNQVVATDDRTNLNIPFMKQANKAIAKTVMRKKDFKTTDKKLDI